MSREPARILLVSHSLSGGGAERFAATLATHLDRRRFSPSIVAATERAGYPLPDDVPVITLGYRGVVTLPRTVLRLRRVIAAAAPDLVLSNVLSTNCLTGAAIASSRPPAWIARVANSPEHGDPWLQRLWGRRVYPRADLVVANSRGLEQAFLRYYPGVLGPRGQSQERTRSIPNPTDFDRLDRSAGEGRPGTRRDGTIRLLWVGRLEPQKRPDLALEALARLRDRGAPHRKVGEAGRAGEALPPLRLTMCGTGSLRSRLEGLVAELGLGDVVELAGFIDRPASVMADADLFLATSDFEGLPNALIEAQGLGLPAVATRCPFGPEEIVEDGVTGVLVPVGDADALATAVGELASDPDRRRRMGEAARRLARERFGLGAVVPRWQEAIEEILAARDSLTDPGEGA